MNHQTYFNTYGDQSNLEDLMALLARCWLFASSGWKFPNFAASKIEDFPREFLFQFCHCTWTLSGKRNLHRWQQFGFVRLASWWNDKKNDFCLF